MTVPAYSDDLVLATRLADAADALTTARFRALDLVVSAKPDRTPVTDADTAVEDAIREILAAERPGDTVAGEERGGSAGSEGRAWVIDPIDGTKNFLRGVPVWATLIALVEDGTPVVGMISAPLLGRRWWAARGEGAHLRDAAGERRTSVSKVATIGDAYLSTTDLSSWTEYHSREKYLALTEACWESRAFGDFWSHCLVAEGAMDVAAECIVNPWDVAAAQVIVTEAGGRFTDLSGAETYEGGSALSTNGLLHDEALAILRRQ
ncbi:histidinol-phosphatase [Amycolatopsis rubida]|uniref:Histidinol-phosphatase n=1 Tax=Amycolatopsis rubida TaxID=112413 RepID=A0ABX0C584_9PSEU|nr:histidinol-phosphatase [Amycolatopsis sp. M39]MYW97484.1 histidinol-phosphatase [Amycolatopsis rubida]NEC62469.1 histidinol-phosphatase [Amycolatopsis rubida]OAP22256.1 Histidinol-phosphatase [Amycolatopsis sp. M39]